VAAESGGAKKKEMSDDINHSQIIQCPFCKAPMTIEELGGSSDLYSACAIWV